jgi:hypothetical protein
MLSVLFELGVKVLQKNNRRYKQTALFKTKSPSSGLLDKLFVRKTSTIFERYEI